jgi:competence protein ComEC
VVKVTFRDTSMLFMGDAEDISEAEILGAGYDVKSNLIKIGHHGSAYSTTENFLKGVQPQYAVISVGKGNDYGHPAQSTVDRLSATGVKILRTDELGTITAISDGKFITIDKKTSPIKEQAPPALTVKTETTQLQSADITVYVTKTGTKYHQDGCRYLSSSKIPIKFSDAKAKGYTPCSVCKPPQ